MKWGETWTPGANYATTLEVSKAVRLNGQPLPAGKYALWMIPAAPPAAWTVLLSKRALAFHEQKPAASDEQLRFSVAPQKGAHMETLAYYFPLVAPDAATLNVHWGTTIVPLRIGVDAPRAARLDPEDRPHYVGRYRMRIRFPEDTAETDVELEVVDVDGKLRLRTTPDVFGKAELIPAGKDRFYFGYPSVGAVNGQLYAEPDVVFVFQVENGHAASVQLTGLDGTVYGHGTAVAR